MQLKIELICGKSNLVPNFDEINNNPNYVFSNDPNFDSVRLFDINNNVVNVNSWIECAHYVNGGWTNNFFDFYSGEKTLFFTITIIFISTLLLKKYYFKK